MLSDLYISLCDNVPQREGQIFGLPLGANDVRWLGIDEKRYPALLLPARPDDIRSDIALRSVDVEFSRLCAIQAADGAAHEGCYSIIRLKDADVDIVRLFLRILEERFCVAPPPSTNAVIAENVLEIASLFSQLSLDARDVVGLWGELFAIECSSDVEAAVKCWSSKKLAKYDFVTTRYVLDVKTTLSHVPKHHFSLEQLRPVGGYEAYVFSLRLVEQHGGLTVGELMDRIAEKITDPELRGNFFRVCVIKGGRDIYRSDLRLLPFPEADSFMLFHASMLPVPTIVENDPISNIRFDVDLSRLEALARAEASHILAFRPAT
ncbi:PD-(D/E)XK motif protein [Ectothiorhodospiraceae bacterium 2226]|nr:PD-(D/E)XK motif protein [Ectothiorhodospiraceae bacterium 2226]